VVKKEDMSILIEKIQRLPNAYLPKGGSVNEMLSDQTTYENAINDAAEIVKSYSPWVSVDKPPDIDESGTSEDILISGVSSSKHSTGQVETSIGWYDKDKGYIPAFWNIGNTFKEITHWMPMPIYINTKI
jgi:hypothetical protein